MRQRPVSLLYLGSPYLDFLYMDVSVDGTHRGQLTHSPQVQFTDTQNAQLFTPSTKQSCSCDAPHDAPHEGQANTLVVTIRTWAPTEHSEILE